MRRKVRGLREIERKILAQRQESAAGTAEAERTSPAAAEILPRNPARVAESEPTSPAITDTSPKDAASEGVLTPSAKVVVPDENEVAEVVLDYCAAVRGILNDDQGGPLHPPGLRMAEALVEVRDSIGRAQVKVKGRFYDRAMSGLDTCIERGMAVVRDQVGEIRRHVKNLQDINKTLDPATGTSTVRRRRFRRLAARLENQKGPESQHMARTMVSFIVGLFAGGNDLELPVDHLDLERAFRLPKGHERRIHGRAHAGVRIVHRGPSLVLVLDAHTRHPDAFSVEDLAPLDQCRDAGRSA